MSGQVAAWKAFPGMMGKVAWRTDNISNNRTSVLSRIIGLDEEVSCEVAAPPEKQKFEANRRVGEHEVGSGVMPTPIFNLIL